MENWPLIWTAWILDIRDRIRFLKVGLIGGTGFFQLKSTSWEAKPTNIIKYPYRFQFIQIQGYGWDFHMKFKEALTMGHLVAYNN